MDQFSEILLEALRQRVESVFGGRPQSPTDFDRLSAQIQAACPRTVAPSTLKRLWGYVRNDHRPTYTTLSLLCRYVGYSDWDAFCRRGVSADDDPDSGFADGCVIVSADLAVGTALRVCWGTAKECVLRKRAEPCEFVVERSANIKLMPGDTVHVDVLGIGGMFMATQCCRDGRQIGAYRGALKAGISRIETVDQHDTGAV